MYNIRHKKEERADLDYYSTDPDSVRALLAAEKFNTNILEPACGGGAISETLKQASYCVKSSDLVPRGYGEVKDFFKIDNWEGDIVTNPPYTEALEFVLHALKITQKGAKIAMLLRLQFLEGSKRYLKLFKTDPPKYVYLFVKRQKCFKNGILELVGGSAVAYAWFVWLKGSKTEPILRWLN